MGKSGATPRNHRPWPSNHPEASLPQCRKFPTRQCAVLRCEKLLELANLSMLAPMHGRYVSYRANRRRVHRQTDLLGAEQIGSAHVSTPVTNAPLVCRLLLVYNKPHTVHSSATATLT